MLAEDPMLIDDRSRVAPARSAASRRSSRGRVGASVDPLAALLHDRRLCLRLGRALEAFGLALRSGPPARAADLAAFARVFRDLVDDWQHERWEHVILPWMVRRGMPFTSPLLRELSELYCLERHLIEVLSELAGRDRRLGAIERQSVLRAALELAAVEQRLWVTLANDVVPSLRRRSADEELDELGEALARFDDRYVQKAGCARALADTRELLNRYATPMQR